MGRNRPKLAGLFLDFNGVVKDDEPPWFKAWQRIHALHGIHLSEREWADIEDTSHYPDFWMRAITGQPATPAEWKEATDEAIAELEQLDVLPGVKELLEDAKRNNVVTALITNSDEAWIQRWFPKSLETHFFAIRTRDAADDPKPNATMYCNALRYLGLHPREVVGVEDTARGVKAVRDAGIHPLYVPGLITKHIDLNVRRLPSLEGVGINQLEAMFLSAARAAPSDFVFSSGR